jgi:hypothetical protein
MMLGFVGSTAIFHTSRAFIGDSSRVKLCPPSLLLWMPSSAPAKIVRGSLGCVARP